MSRVYTKIFGKRFCTFPKSTLLTLSEVKVLNELAGKVGQCFPEAQKQVHLVDSPATGYFPNSAHDFQRGHFVEGNQVILGMGGLDVPRLEGKFGKVL